MDLLNAYMLGILLQAMVAVMLGLSIYFTLSAGLLSVGHAGFMSVGAYTAALLTLHWHWPMPLGLLAAAFMGALAGLLLGLPTLRLRGVYLAIATLGFGEVVRVVFLNMQLTGGALGLKNIPSMTRNFRTALDSRGIEQVAGLSTTQSAQILTLLIAVAIIALIMIAIRRQETSRIGRAIRALGADEVAAEVAGIPIVSYRMLVFIEGAAVAGLAGGFFAYINNIVQPEMFGFNKAVDIMLYAVLGGSGIIWGPVFGALTLSLLPEFLRFLKEYRNVIFGALLVFMMAVRPQGLIDQPLMNALRRVLSRLFRRRTATGSAADKQRSVSGGDE